MNFNKLLRDLQGAARKTAEGVSRILQRGRGATTGRGGPQPSPATSEELNQATQRALGRIARLPGFAADEKRLREAQAEIERALAYEIEQQRAQQRRWEEFRQLGGTGPSGMPSVSGSAIDQGAPPNGLGRSVQPQGPIGQPGSDTGQGGGPATWIGPTLDQDDLDLMHGTLHPVESSNVHSIGMQVSMVGARTGTLLIRFLGTLGNGKRGGKGPTYAYADVPVALYREFRVASSKGKFVWDHVRVRGTVSGHRFAYELIGVVNGYVPRQAGLKRGQPGEWFMQRTWTGFKVNRQTGKLERVTLQSRLPEQRVSMRGPNPGRGPGPGGLRFTP